MFQRDGLLSIVVAVYVVLAAVRQDGEALQYASQALQNDQEVVLAAVQQRAIWRVYADPNKIHCSRQTTRTGYTPSYGTLNRHVALQTRRAAYAFLLYQLGAVCHASRRRPTPESISIRTLRPAAL